MENLSHTLIGLAAGEAFARCTPAEESASGLPQQVRRSLFVTLATIGGNAPDLDLAWSYGWPDRKLGYMLQHRGYTHTVLGCLVLAGLLYAGAEWWLRRRGLTPSRRDRIHLLAVAIVATLLHLGMDALNSYGVHPFWPFENHWLYGDSIFIAEPLFWLASAPLISLARSRLARCLIGVAVILALGISIWVHSGSLPWVACLATVTLALGVVGQRASPRTAALTSVAAMTLVAGVGLICGTVAARRIDDIAGSGFPGYRMLDHVLTPTLTQPLCWDAFVLASQGDRYVIRHAVLSIAPILVTAVQCAALAPQTRPASAPGEPVAPRERVPLRSGTPAPPKSRVDARDSASIFWLSEYSMSRAQLVGLVEEHCEAAALMQFARAPFAFRYGRTWFIGDLRFERGAGFQIEVGDGSAARCSIRVPWVPPRLDLLRIR